MNKLSEQQLKNLNEAIDRTMDTMADSGGDPNKAIVKVATDMHLTPDYLPVLVSAYNNGAQYAQRESGNTITEKTAKFNIADLDVINEMLGNTSVKQAGYLIQESDNFFNFSASTNGITDRFKIAPTMPIAIKAASYTRDNSTQIKLETGINDKVNTVVESIRMEKSAAADEYDDAIKDLAYYLRQSIAPSVPFATKLASMVYGTAGGIVVKTATDRFSLPEKAKSMEPVLTIKDAFYNHCKTCIDKLAKYNKICDEELSLLSKCAKALKPSVERRVNALYANSAENDASPAYFFKKKDNIKVAEDLGINIRPEKPAGDVQGLESLLKPQWRHLSPYEHNIMRALDDPEHEATLRDISVNSDLTDLINTDEYLSDKDPEEVLDAYNELMEIAPEIHNKKPLLRAALRQYMESGGIDVQSLGLIGDIGRKSESRTDMAKKELGDRLEKFIETADKNKLEDKRMLAQLNAMLMRNELTVSEGRKDRMMRAELARKQLSEQRRNNEARDRAEKDRMLLMMADRKADRQARIDLEKLKDSMQKDLTKTKDYNARMMARQRTIDAKAEAKQRLLDAKDMETQRARNAFQAKTEAELMERWGSRPSVTFNFDQAGRFTGSKTVHNKGLGFHRINDYLSDTTQPFNSLDRSIKKQVYEALDEMGFGHGSPISDKLRNFDPNTYDLLPNATVSITMPELEAAIKAHATRLNPF